MYRTAKDRAADERQRAALWLFLQDRGLMADFLAFYRGLRDASLTDMAQALRMQSPAPIGQQATSTTSNETTRPDECREGNNYHNNQTNF